MLKNFKIINTIVPFIISYIILYAIYIQLNGEESPGGGFQAGVIFASSIIAYDLVSNRDGVFSANSLIICSTLGVGLYVGVGLISLFFDNNYLDYNSIADDNVKGQYIGIFLIELGVGLTVSSVMCLIYSLLRKD